jgi:cell division protein FtsX
MKLRRVVLGLALNAYATAGRVFGHFSSNAKIIIFINETGNLEVIREKLVNMDGLAGFDLVGKDKIAQDANLISPTIKEVLDAGENPFTPYYVVKPRRTTLASYEAVVKELKSVKGADDVRYDAELVEMTQNLARFLRVYRLSVNAALAGCVGLMVFLIIMHSFSGRFSAGTYLLYAAIGFGAGLAGVGMYYWLASSSIVSVVGQLSQKHMLVMVPAGIVMALGLAGLDCE